VKELSHDEHAGVREATAYQKGSEIVISFAGTGPGASVDWVSNALLALGLTWDQGIDQQPQDVQNILPASWH